MNKQQLQQEIEELQKQLEEKQKALASIPDKWEPKGGEWFVTISGSVSNADEPKMDVTRFGVEYATRQQAEKAAKAMRAHNRLLAYVAEFAPDCDDCADAYVAKSKVGKTWEAIINGTRSESVTVYMPYRVAADLARKLNSGEVEL